MITRIHWKQDSYEEHLEQLIYGKNVEILIYNFARHLRDSKSKKVVPCQILIVDDILVLNDDHLRKMMNLKVFVDVPPDLRFIRRLERDLCERGRSVESVIRQYLDPVRPMHEKFVEPSRQHANIIILGGGHNLQAVQLLLALLQTLPEK